MRLLVRQSDCCGGAGCRPGDAAILWRQWVRSLKVLLLPSIPYGPYHRTSTPGDEPDHHAAARALAAQGVEMDTIDPYKFPLNPLAGRHPLLQSLDPLRSLQALLSGHRYDIVISGNDGPAVLLALLRRLFRLKASVLVWDLSPAVVWRRRAWLQDVILPKVDGILALPAMQEAYARERWGVRTWQPASSSIPISISRKRGIPVTIYFPSATTLDAITRLCLPPPDAWTLRCGSGPRSG